MPISLQIEGERQNPKGEPWWHLRSTELLVRDHPGTCCLRFIDPYGDVTFNQMQVPELIAELNAFADTLSDAESQTVILDLIAYVTTAQDRVHTYVRFVGD